MISEKRRKNLILLAMTTSTALIFLNATLLPVALPTIQRELNISSVSLQWIINAYLLANAAFVIAGGRLGDLFGHRRLFCIGVVLYSVSSVMGSLAETGWWLIMSRAIQGSGGALMTPSGMSLLIHAFPGNERGKAIGKMVAIGSLFLSIGPFIGGAFTEYLSWRYAFLINPPVAILGVLLTLKVVPKSKPKKGRFDFLGFITMSSGIFCLTLALMQGKVWGWSSGIVLFLFLLALSFFCAVCGLEKKVQDPFFQFRLFKNRTFLGGCLLILCTQFILMITVFWPLYFQQVFMDSPMVAGLVTVIATIPLMLFAPIGGSLADKRGACFPIVVGFICLAGSLIWFAFALSWQNTVLLQPALFLFGLGIAFVMTPASSATLSAVPKTQTGVATGMYNTLRFTGATMGVAILGAMQINLQEGMFTQKLQQNPETAALNPVLYEGLLGNLPHAIQAAKDLRPEVLTYVKSALLNAATAAFSLMHLVAAGIAILGLIIALQFLRKKEGSVKGKKEGAQK